MKKQHWLIAMRLALVALGSTALGCGATVGDACTTPKDCPGGSCINDLYAPGGYCSKGCDPEQISPCPDASVCVRAGSARSYSTCLKSCDQPSDCRDGYECKVVEGSVRAVCIGLGGR